MKSVTFATLESDCRCDHRPTDPCMYPPYEHSVAQIVCELLRPSPTTRVRKRKASFGLPNVPTKRFSINSDECLLSNTSSSDLVSLAEKQTDFTPEIHVSAAAQPAMPAVGRQMRSLSRRRFSMFPDELADTTPEPTPPSKRHLRVLELLDTERNYVNILETMLDIIRSIPLDTDHPNSIFLQPDFVDEISTTFSQLPNLLKTHRMIVADLEAATADWTENASIGAIFTKYGPDLEAYVPFVNSFEKIKLFLMEWEANCTRFHAYLKFRQMEPASGRQTLHELLIRPIQRVPSVVSLLRDIKSRTDESNPDSLELDKAIAEVQRVLSFINEQKREAEVRELLQDIASRPANNLQCTFATYLCRLECIELEDGQFDERESVLTMILFQDVIEICRKKSISSKRYSQLSQPKQWEHVDFVPVDRIRELVDVPDAVNCNNAFTLSLVSVEDEDCRYKFAAIGEFQLHKSAFLRQVAAQVTAAAPLTGLPHPTTVLRRIASEEMRIRTTTVLAPKNPGLRSTSLVLRKVTRPAVLMAKKLHRTWSRLIFVHVSELNPPKKVTSFASRPHSMLC